VPAPPSSLKGRALRYLAAREHSRAELERKLARFCDRPEDIARVLDELTVRGFISEQRVVESVLYRRADKLGSARVLNELRTKGLSDDAIEQAAETLRASELERARAVWRKKFGMMPASPAERARQMRFLAARGFSGDVVRRVLRGGDTD
jgi:regulatory protein